jgi:hypothetical protein
MKPSIVMGCDESLCGYLACPADGYNRPVSVEKQASLRNIITVGDEGYGYLKNGQHKRSPVNVKSIDTYRWSGCLQQRPYLQPSSVLYYSFWLVLRR